eukprot:gene6122-9400_t
MASHLTDVAHLPHYEPFIAVFADEFAAHAEVKGRRSRVSEPRGVFEGRLPQKIPSLVRRMVRYGKFDANVFLVAAVYVERLTTGGFVELHSETATKVTAGCLIAAAKWLEDSVYTNTHYATVAGCSLKQVNAMEAHILRTLDFRLSVSPNEAARIRLRYETHPSFEKALATRVEAVETARAVHELHNGCADEAAVEAQPAPQSRQLPPVARRNAVVCVAAAPAGSTASSVSSSGFSSGVSSKAKKAAVSPTEAQQQQQPLQQPGALLLSSRRSSPAGATPPSSASSNPLGGRGASFDAPDETLATARSSFFSCSSAGTLRLTSSFSSGVSSRLSAAPTRRTTLQALALKNVERSLA